MIQSVSTRLLCSLALLMTPSMAFAQDREGPALSRVFPHFDTFLEIPEGNRNCFDLTFVFRSSDDVEADDIHIWYEFEGEVIALLLTDYGRVINSPLASHLEADPNIWINEDAGGMSSSMNFEASMPMGETYTSQDMTCAMDQANDAMREVGGIAAMFAPKFKEAVFLFEGSAPSAWAIHENGERTELIVQENRVLFRPKARNMRRVTHIEFGRAPYRIMLNS